MSVGKCQACPGVSSDRCPDGSVLPLLANTASPWRLPPCACRARLDITTGTAVGRDQRHFFSVLEKGNNEEKDDLMWVKCFLALTQPKCWRLHRRAGGSLGGPGNNEWNRELSWETGGHLHSLPCLCLPFLCYRAREPSMVSYWIKSTVLNRALGGP